MTKATILFVDNSREFADVSARLLEQENYRVIIALTAIQAEEMLKKGGIDLALIDLRLADEDNEHDTSGLNLALKIAPSIPKIIQSAYLNYEYVMKTLTANRGDKTVLVDVIAKQEGPAELLAAIDRLISTYKDISRRKESVLTEKQKEHLARSDEQFEGAHIFFDQQLESIGLSKAQIENQKLDELSLSLDRVNDAIKFPESFGTLRLRATSTGLVLVANNDNYHYEIGILPILLARKKLILDRVNLFKAGDNIAKHDLKTKKTAKLKATATTKKSSIVKVLFLAANPKDTPQLRLDEEMRAIDNTLVQTEFRDRFEIKQYWAVRVFDIQGYLLRHKPDIIHFSGHGSSNSEIILEDNAGNSHSVSPRALSQLFSVLKDNIRCVVLNACYSEQQAQAIAEHIDCVVGMSRAISDSAAIGFSAAFYQGLGFGRDIKTAFDLGCIQIDLENLGEENTPKLLALRINPKELVFISSSK